MKDYLLESGIILKRPSNFIEYKYIVVKHKVRVKYKFNWFKLRYVKYTYDDTYRVCWKSNMGLWEIIDLMKQILSK